MYIHTTRFHFRLVLSYSCQYKRPFFFLPSFQSKCCHHIFRRHFDSTTNLSRMSSFMAFIEILGDGQKSNYSLPYPQTYEIFIYTCVVDYEVLRRYYVGSWQLETGNDNNSQTSYNYVSSSHSWIPFFKVAIGHEFLMACSISSYIGSSNSVNFLIWLVLSTEIIYTANTEAFFLH